MDLFTLMGTIKIDADAALSTIEQVTGQAEGLYNTINGNGTTGSGTTGTTSYWSSLFTNLGKTAIKSLTALDVAAGNLLSSATTKVLSAGKSFMQTGFEYNQNMEKWVASFKTYMDGDLEAASAFFDEVRQFAIETPLSLSDSVEAAVRLMASGIKSNDVIDTLTMLGDIANGDTEKLSKLALVYSQVVSAKKLKGNDPNQFKEAGVPIYDLLLEYYNSNGYSIDSATLMEWQTKGSITSDEVYGALKMATSEGGMYYNAMNNLMDTEYGKAQKMTDNYEQAAGAFVKAFFDVFSSDTINGLNEMLDKLYTWANENPESLKALADSFNYLAVNGLGALLETVTELIEFYAEHQETIATLLQGLGAYQVYTGKTVSGMALFALGTGLRGATAESAMEDDIAAYAEAKANGETPSASLASTLLGDDVMEKLANGATYYDLTDEEKENYDFTKAIYEMGTYGSAASDLLGIGQGDEHGPLGQFLLDLEEFVKQVLNGDYYKNEASEATNGAVTPEMYDAVKDVLDTAGDSSTDNLPSSTLDFLKNWLFPDDDDSSLKHSVDTFVTAPTDLEGTSGSLPALLNTLQATLTTLPAQIQSASAAGVADGMSGITITGNITTGEVRLNEGALVGALYPRINLRLGWQNMLDSRGV